MLARIAVITALLGCFALAGIAYSANDRAERYLKANKLLAEAVATVNADVAVHVDERNGDLYVRINGIHYHYFEKICLGPSI